MSVVGVPWRLHQNLEQRAVTSFNYFVAACVVVIVIVVPSEFLFRRCAAGAESIILVHVYSQNKQPTTHQRKTQRTLRNQTIEPGHTQEAFTACPVIKLRNVHMRGKLPPLEARSTPTLNPVLRIHLWRREQIKHVNIKVLWCSTWRGEPATRSRKKRQRSYAHTDGADEGSSALIGSMFFSSSALSFSFANARQSYVCNSSGVSGMKKPLIDKSCT